MSRFSAVSVIVFLVAVLQGCNQHLEQQCLAPQGQEPVDLAADGLLGRWSLVLIADSGPRAGHADRGRLTLWAGDSSRDTLSDNSTGYRRVLGGSTRVLPREIGVDHLPVPLSSRTPHQPGVQGWAPESGSGGIRLVLGGRRPEGEGIAMEIVARDGTGLRGWWREAGVSERRPAGHFCLTR